MRRPLLFLIAGLALSACKSAQQIPACGDGLVDPGEECDDGNTVNGDGCDAACQNELPSGSCGDGLIDQGEECDDGNLSDADGCSALCTIERCGDGVVQPPESCDDGNNLDGDGCDAACQRELDPSLQIDVGSFHTCAILEAGAVRCWGRGSLGRLGYGNTDNIGDNEVPADLAADVDVGGAVVQLALGGSHTCALLDTGSVRCWGKGGVDSDADGIPEEGSPLGYGNTETIGDDESPASAGDVPLGGVAVQIAAGAEHSCALLDTGGVRCWGLNNVGQLGYGNTEAVGDDETPESVGDVPLGGAAVQISLGEFHSCALLETGAVRCWGEGGSGRLGYGNTNDIGDDETPESAGDIDLGGAAVQISVGSINSCALLDTGALRCWGSGGRGQLGQGNEDNIGDDESPASAGEIEVGGSVSAVAAGAEHICALLDTGSVRCWGFGFLGQLGYGNTNSIGDDELPSAAGDVPVGGPVSAIAAGGSHTCALLDGGAVRCWGFNFVGQLGYGNISNIGDDEPAEAAGDVPVL